MKRLVRGRFAPCNKQTELIKPKLGSRAEAATAAGRFGYGLTRGLSILSASDFSGAIWFWPEVRSIRDPDNTTIQRMDRLFIRPLHRRSYPKPGRGRLAYRRVLWLVARPAPWPSSTTANDGRPDSGSWFPPGRFRRRLSETSEGISPLLAHWRRRRPPDQPVGRLASLGGDLFEEPPAAGIFHNRMKESK